MSYHFVYRAQILPERRLPSDQLIKRWTNEQVSELRAILLTGEEFPKWVSLISVKFRDAVIELSDLRGVDLSNMNLSNVDLSYCALDFANLSETNLSRSRLQYSRLYRANFSGATLEKTQASPVDAEGALFTGASVRDSFFMCSNLARAVFNHADLKGSSFGGADIEGVVAVEATGSDFSEIKSASISPVRDVRRNEISEKFSSRKSLVRNYVYLINEINNSLSLFENSLNVNINKSDAVIGHVVPSNDGRLLVSVPVNKYKTYKFNKNKKERVYRIQSPKDSYSVGDIVEIVSYRPNPLHPSKRRTYSNSRKSAVGLISLGKNKKKTKKWLVARLIAKAGF